MPIFDIFHLTNTPPPVLYKMRFVKSSEDTFFVTPSTCLDCVLPRKWFFFFTNKSVDFNEISHTLMHVVVGPNILVSYHI